MLKEELIREWHPTKNKGFGPGGVTPGSHIKVWWKCEKGHEWEARIYTRVRGTGCPYCSGHKVSPDNSLEKLKPNIASEWHPTKNKAINASDVSPGSGKKVWWICKKGHEWETVVNDRNKGKGCPYCSGVKVDYNNSLTSKMPELLKEWHPAKNLEISPNVVSLGSKKIVWWICKKGHEWKAAINHRAKGTKCPYCSGRKACKDNCLAEMFPSLEKEWNKSKNKINAYDVVPGSHKKVWWKCENGHEWECVIRDRVKGRSCPFCTNRIVKERTLKDNRLSKAFPDLVEEWHFIKNENIDLENITFGSSRKVWWECKKEHEWEATVKRTRGSGCPYCANKKVCNDNCLATIKPELAKEWNYEKNTNLTPFEVTYGSYKKVWWKCDKGHEWEARISERYNGTDCPYCSGNKVSIDNCLATLNPILIKEWDHNKNKSLTPYDVTLFSTKKVWWKCDEGHEWKAEVCRRTAAGTGCPYCSNNKVCIDNCLATTKPELAKEWHPSKNTKITPYDVTYGSNRKVWWECRNGHECKRK